MERHFPLKPGQPIEMARVILNSFTEFPNQGKEPVCQKWNGKFWSSCIFRSEETETDLSISIVTEISGIFGIMESAPCLFLINPYNSTMIMVMLAKFTFLTIVSCSTLKIGPHLFYIEKFITQFKAIEKNDRSPYSFLRKWQFTSMARFSRKEKGVIF